MDYEKKYKDVFNMKAGIVMMIESVLKADIEYYKEALTRKYKVYYSRGKSQEERLRNKEEALNRVGILKNYGFKVKAYIRPRRWSIETFIEDTRVSNLFMMIYNFYVIGIDPLDIKQ